MPTCEAVRPERMALRTTCRRTNERNVKPKVLEALVQFSGGSDVHVRARALNGLLVERALSKVVDTDDFRRGFDSLVSEAHDASSAETTLAAIAQLVRLAQAHPPLSESVAAAISPVLERPLPALTLLASGPDRAYIAKALSGCREDWVAGYAANAIAEEATAEKTRTEFMQLLFDNTSSVESVLARLIDALESVKIDTEKPAESLYRRVTRILGAFRTVLATSRLSSGSSPGKALARLVTLQLARYGGNVSSDVARDLVAEVIRTTHQLVRSRFALATDSDTYAALKQVKTGLAPQAWPRGTEEDRELVAETIQEAMLLLAKQEITSQPLRYLLELVTDIPTSDRALARMAEKNPELSESVRAWLARRPTTTEADDGGAVKRQDQLDSDPLVAECLLARRQLLRTQSGVRNELLAALEIYDPGLAASFRQFVTGVSRVTDEIDALAKARNLMLLGTAGDEMAFARKYFDVLDGPPREHMTVERPAVVRRAADGSPGAVVVKGVMK